MFNLLNLIHTLRWAEVAGNNKARKMNQRDNGLIVIGGLLRKKISLESKGHHLPKEYLERGHQLPMTLTPKTEK